MVAICSFALVTIVAIEGPGCIIMACGAVGCSGGRIMVSVASGLPRPVIGGVVATRTISNRFKVYVTVLAAYTVCICCRVMSVSNTSGMAANTSGQRLHIGVTGSAVDRSGRVCCGNVMRRSDLTLMTAEAVNQITNIGMTFSTIPRSRGHRIVMTILLGNKCVTGSAISVGRHTFMTLVTETLRIKL